MSKGTRPEPPREAALIDAARRRSRLSAREAAKRAHLSDARWRQITSGYQSVSGESIPVHAPAETLARMAQVVGVTADELARVGRQDAADALEEITPLPQPAAAANAFSPPADAVYAILASLSPEEQAEVVRRLARENPSVVQPSGGHQRQAG
ncbi:helix-turn-helix domain-containing protein [Streptomyces sp. CCM_MD2014]|uniref:helix-turn-helix domain-containing protein n=1 Tax=Streptomyces sp. CCM_MD2014 TaxID=1561022 RepID=UPI00077684C8|nr:helix-turn-helix domain-containing protein [Streptomyces sp. CCM_MD2014]